MEMTPLELAVQHHQVSSKALLVGNDTISINSAATGAVVGGFYVGLNAGDDSIVSLVVALSKLPLVAVLVATQSFCKASPPSPAQQSRVVTTLTSRPQVVCFRQHRQWQQRR